MTTKNLKNRLIFFISFVVTLASSSSLEPQCTINDFIHFKKILIKDSSSVSNFNFKQSKPSLITHFSLCNQLPDDAFTLCGIEKQKDVFFIEVRNGKCDIMKFSKFKEITYQDKSPEKKSLSKKDQILAIFNHEKTKQITLEFYAHGKDYEVTFPDYTINEAVYEETGHTVKIKIPGNSEKDIPVIKGGYYWTNEYTFYWWAFNIVKVFVLFGGFCSINRMKGKGGLNLSIFVFIFTPCSGF